MQADIRPKFFRNIQRKAGRRENIPAPCPASTGRKNANMAIWLGKQYLGQSDRGEYTVAVDRREDDPLTLALKETARAIERSEGDNAGVE